MRERTHVVFLDWDGTLCTGRFWGSLRTGAEAERETYEIVQRLLFGEEKERVRAWMRGTLSSEDVCDWLAPQVPIGREALWRALAADCAAMPFDPALRLRAERLREVAYVVLATGNMDCFTRFTVPALGLDASFDRILNTADLGYLKTERDGEMFRACLADYGVPMNRAILVEDALHTCASFEKWGGTAYRVSGPEETARRLDEITATFRS